MVITEEIRSVFKRWKTQMGAPIVEVEVTDDMLCDALELATEDYASEVQNQLIENQWSALFSKTLSKTDLAFALSTRQLDLSRDLSYWFSREKGLQQRGPYELKKDYLIIECGKQDYVIPAGREINRVMFMAEPSTPAAIYTQLSAGAWGLAGGLNMGMMGGVGFAGTGTYGLFPFFFGGMSDIGTMAQHISNMRRIFTNDVYYTVTAGPEGTHIVHLHGSNRFSFLPQGMCSNGVTSLNGCVVYYTYYDVSNGDADECRRLHPDDIILTPDQIPLNRMDYAFLNEPTKVIVRNFFFYRATMALAMVRGKFSGTIMIPDAEAKLDYQMLISMADKWRDDAIKELRERLQRITPYGIVEREAKMADDMYKIMSGKPMMPIVV